LLAPKSLLSQVAAIVILPDNCNAASG